MSCLYWKMQLSWRSLKCLFKKYFGLVVLWPALITYAFSLLLMVVLVHFLFSLLSTSFAQSWSNLHIPSSGFYPFRFLGQWIPLINRQSGLLHRQRQITASFLGVLQCQDSFSFSVHASLCQRGASWICNLQNEACMQLVALMSRTLSELKCSNGTASVGMAAAVLEQLKSRQILQVRPASLACRLYNKKDARMKE